MTSRPLRVFLCHSSNDKPAVRQLYQKLRTEPWIQPWLDEEELFPGMDWNTEIEKAIEETDAIVVCLSNNSITKEGYVQKEITKALDYSDYKPEGAVFIIPVRLEECKPPSRLSKWQYADYFEGQRERGIQRLLVSLRKRAESLGLDMYKETIADLDDNQVDGLIEKAISFIRSNQLASASLLQNHLQIGYMDAVNLIDQLEEMGVIGPSKGRDVYVVEDDRLGDDEFED